MDKIYVYNMKNDAAACSLYTFDVSAHLCAPFRCGIGGKELSNG